MLFLLSKILIFLLKPFIWTLILFLIAIFSKSALTKKRFLILGFISILFFSNELIIGKIFNWYESSYPPIANYDVGILLGGFASINERNNSIQFGSAEDRFNQTLLLYKKGVIKKILVTGGNSNFIDKKVKESDLASNYLRAIGVPDSSILIENQSRNTLENANLSAKVIAQQFTKPKVLVITSAWHIPRAKLVFNRYFPNAQYYPTNFIGKTNYDLADCIIPSATALNNWDLLIKEWIGLLVDRYRN